MIISAKENAVHFAAGDGSYIVIHCSSPTAAESLAQAIAASAQKAETFPEESDEALFYSA